MHKQGLFGAPLLFMEVTRQKSTVRAVAGRFSLPILSAELFVSARLRKSSDTLFILGSGESILQLSEKHWAEVRDGVSVGVGAWTIHPFVPDFLALEHINPNPEMGTSSSNETLVEQSYRQALEGWHLRDEVRKVNPQILFFRPPATSRGNRLAPLGDYGLRNTWLYGRVGSASKTLDGLRTELHSYFKWASLSAIPDYLPFDTGATISRLISLGVRAGFKRIVLAGVDLRDSRYFWDASPGFLAERGLDSFTTSETYSAHSTEAGRRFATSDVLETLQQFLTIRNQNILYSGHSSSWLSTRLPVYF
jgi:hypothetical protein